MTATKIRMTADELPALPDNGMRQELLAEELHEWPLHGGDHGYICGLVALQVGMHLRSRPGLGGGLFATGTGFRIACNPDTVRAPDLAYVGPERLAQARVRGYPELAPDFVVEVVSPSDMAAKVQQKAEEWLRAGVRLVWVLYPTTRSAMAYSADGSVHLLHAEDTITAEPVLPQVACRLSDLFCLRHQTTIHGSMCARMRHGIEHSGRSAETPC